MRNELCRIGAIIYDLKRNLKLLPSTENQEFLDDEFRRIVLSLDARWHDKAMGWEYLLEFHMQEADRLSESLDDLYVGNLLHGRRSDYIDKMTATKTDFRVN